MLRKLAAETLERRTVFSASALVPLAGDLGHGSFMDYTDDSVQEAPPLAATIAVSGDFNGDADVDGNDFLIWQRQRASFAGDGFGLLPFVEQDNGYRAGSSRGPQDGAATDAIMAEWGRDPQGIIAILIGLYAPKGGAAADPNVQQLELENTLISNYVAQPTTGDDAATVPGTAVDASAVGASLRVELENVQITSVASSPGKQTGILHEDNEFSFPRM